MNDFFFISSPLHFYIATNIALQHSQHHRTAIFISKTPHSSARYAAVARNFPDIFNKVVFLSGQVFSAEAKLRIAELFSPGMNARIFTGNDRRGEFQYAMHIASALCAQVKGVYMDEGAVTYLGHKSMHTLQHRYIDPFFKKIIRGLWWKNAVTTGASDWISTAYVAFPQHVHPLLRKKRLVPIDTAIFKTEKYTRVVESLFTELGTEMPQLRHIKAVLTLPHEGYYFNNSGRYKETCRTLTRHFDHNQIGIKPHPRISDPLQIAHDFAGMMILDHGLGMEMLLPLLADDCIVIGDISSTLLTTRWLRPDMTVIALADGDCDDTMLSLYHELKIPVSERQQMDDFLASI